MTESDPSADAADRLPDELRRGGRVICADCGTIVALEQHSSASHWLVCGCRSVRLSNASEVDSWQPRFDPDGGHNG